MGLKFCMCTAVAVTDPLITRIRIGNPPVIEKTTEKVVNRNG